MSLALITESKAQIIFAVETEYRSQCVLWNADIIFSCAKQLAADSIIEDPDRLYEAAMHCVSHYCSLPDGVSITGSDLSSIRSFPATVKTQLRSITQ